MSRNYLEYVLDLLSHCDSITSRAMFGGYGIYKNGVIFAIIAHDELYFKVDQSNIDLYKKQGSEAFTFETKGRVSTMISYWKVPLIIMEDETQLKDWVEQSYNISLKNKMKPT